MTPPTMAPVLTPEGTGEDVLVACVPSEVEEAVVAEVIDVCEDEGVDVVCELDGVFDEVDEVEVDVVVGVMSNSSVVADLAQAM